MTSTCWQEIAPCSVRALCLRQTPWRAVWTEDRVRPSVGKTRWPVWVRGLKGLPGVYLVRDLGARGVAYVGRSRSCVKSALLRHFRVWGEDSRGPHRRVVFDRRAVEAKVYVLRDPAHAVSVEARLIALHDPSENRRREQRALAREPGWFDGPPLECWDDDDLDGVPF